MASNQTPVKEKKKNATTKKTKLSNFRKVQEFHDTFAPAGQRPDTPELVADDLFTLRLDLIEEEVDEFVLAYYNGDLVGVADGLGDILYVVYGAADVMGIDADVAFAEIHRSNMTKLGEDGKPIYREDGKVLKGPSYEAPDLRKVLGLENY